MKRINISAILACGALAAALALAGCNNSDEGPAEKAGKQLDKAAGQMKQSVGNAAEQAGDEAEQAGDKIKNATE